MIYNNETYIGTARDVYDLIVLLTDEAIPKNAFLKVSAPEHSANCEVWYDEETNTVLLK
jgi:hypothetical protein